MADKKTQPKADPPLAEKVKYQKTGLHPNVRQGEIKFLINVSVDLIENGTIISSPANKYIVYKLETAFEIIVTHEQRHYNQAVQVYAGLNQQL